VTKQSYAEFGSKQHPIVATYPQCWNYTHSFCKCGEITSTFV